MPSYYIFKSWFCITLRLNFFLFCNELKDLPPFFQLSHKKRHFKFICIAPITMISCSVSKFLKCKRNNNVTIILYFKPINIAYFHITLVSSLFYNILFLNNYFDNQLGNAYERLATNVQPDLWPMELNRFFFLPSRQLGQLLSRINEYSLVHIPYEITVQIKCKQRYKVFLIKDI